MHRGIYTLHENGKGFVMTQGITSSTSVGQNYYVRNGQKYTVPEGVDPKKALIFQIMQEAEGESKGKVRDYAIDQLKDAGLWKGDENKETRKFFGKKFTNFLGRFIGKEADVYATARAVAVDNKMERISNTGELGKVRKKGQLEEKLRQAGYTDANGNIDIESLQSLYNDVAGSDKEITYSSKAAELKHLQSALNNNGNDVEFDLKEVKRIIKALGGHKEAAIDPYKLVTATAGGAAVGSGIGLAMPITQTVTTGGVAGSAYQKTTMFPAGAVTGAALGLGASIYNQVSRNEKPIAVELTDDNVKTLEDARKHFETVCTSRNIFGKLKTNKKEAELMTNIAAYFVDPETGEIDKAAFNNAIRARAGEQSVLNKKEAWNLLSELSSGKYSALDFIEADCPEVVDPEIGLEEQPTTPPQQGTKEEVKPAGETVVQSDCPDTVIVQAGESPASIARRYGVNEQELRKLNADKLHRFTNNCGEYAGTGFLVDEEIRLPEAVDCEKAAKEAAKNIKGEQNIQNYVTKITPYIQNGSLCEDDKAVRADLFRAIKEKAAQ